MNVALPIVHIPYAFNYHLIFYKDHIATYQANVILGTANNNCKTHFYNGSRSCEFWSGNILLCQRISSFINLAVVLVNGFNLDMICHQKSQFSG